MFIAQSGPLLHHVDTILIRIVDKHWCESCCCVRKTDDVQNYADGNSKVLGKLLKDQSKLNKQVTGYWNVVNNF